MEKKDESISYNTDFICTYNLIKEYEDSELLYQIQFLQAFNLEEFNEKIINKLTKDLFYKFKENKYILNLIHVNTEYENNQLDNFRLCFRYDTFYLIHSLLVSLLDNYKIDEKKYNELLKKNKENLNIL